MFFNKKLAFGSECLTSRHPSQILYESKAFNIFLSCHLVPFVYAPLSFQIFQLVDCNKVRSCEKEDEGTGGNLTLVHQLKKNDAHRSIMNKNIHVKKLS